MYVSYVALRVIVCICSVDLHSQVHGQITLPNVFLGMATYPVLYPVVSMIIPCTYVCTQTVHCITYAHMYVLVAFKVASQGTFGTHSLSL